MWTMLGSWTMSVTQLVEASCVSQKCTVPAIYLCKMPNLTFHPEKVCERSELRLPKVPIKGGKLVIHLMQMGQFLTL